VLGAAHIADKALLPALRAARNAETLAIASRDPGRARAVAEKHGVPRVHDSYDSLLADAEIDAVYIPLTNDQHLPWSLRALAAGKHVLCEKPLAMSSAEAEQMAAAAGAAGRLLMEAFMYRFHPRQRELVASMEGRTVRHVAATFGFRLRDPANYRAQPELGGGALMDVGCYCIDVARWLLGEPVGAHAYMRSQAVDMTVTGVLRFDSGATASIWASFESPERQSLEVVTDDQVIRVERPFSSMEPEDPYRVMVEEFSAAALEGRPSPLPLEWSIANLHAIELVRGSAAT
jgi:D-xylose 1-dehydrogenase (NADP+, D-xylono-1,5-lactone-forming)